MSRRSSRATYLELEQSLLDCYLDHLQAADPVANAPEVRMLRRMVPELSAISRGRASRCQTTQRSAPPRVARELARGPTASELAGYTAHRQRVARLISNAGGVSGLEPPAPGHCHPSIVRALRPPAARSSSTPASPAAS